MNENTQDNGTLRGVAQTLQTWAWQANKGEQEDLHISLLVKGLIVSGTLIGVKEYSSLTQIQYDFDEKKIESTPPLTIKLKNCRIFIPGNAALPTNEPIVWEGNLDSIDGFWLGLLESIESLG